MSCLWRGRQTRDGDNRTEGSDPREQEQVRRLGLGASSLRSARVGAGLLGMGSYFPFNSPAGAPPPLCVPMEGLKSPQHNPGAVNGDPQSLGQAGLPPLSVASPGGRDSGLELPEP